MYQNGLLDRNVNRLIDTKGMNRISGIPCLILEGIRPFQFRESEQLFFWKATNSCRIGTYRWIDYGKTLKYNECLEDVRMEFKEKLQLLRTNMKLSQEELANRLDISRQSITKWENGVSQS